MPESAVAALPSPPRLVFDRPAAPRVSVIVLAWRLTGELIDLLSSLRASVGAPEFDLHLVLNGADNAVRDVIAQQVEGAYVTTIPFNVGFGGGCNAGAAGARGISLAFLNDDAVVEPEWLATITAFASQHERQIGAVCSLLMNEDGTVQEAGGRVRRDAGTVQFGKGVTPEAAARDELLQPRRVDYGSGAALLVSRGDFEAVGGFDDAFEPAYYEDVDLCFRLTAASREVWLCPGARVVHHSGRSTATDRRFRDFASSRSGQRFIERWAPTLEHAPDDDAPVSEICRPDIWGTASVPTRTETIPVEHTAIAIQRSFAAWLDEQLTAAELSWETERELSRAEFARLRADSDDVRHRLEDLEARGPIGIARWQAGIVVRRARAWRARRREERSD